MDCFTAFAMTELFMESSDGHLSCFSVAWLPCKLKQRKIALELYQVLAAIDQ
jgi:hypothetical protein